jgi:hypothetical protein
LVGIVAAIAAAHSSTIPVPVADGSDRDAELSSDLASPEAFLVSEPQRLGNRLPAVHYSESEECGGWDSNPHVLSDTAA